jgi:argininosuccinate lyase
MSKKLWGARFKKEMDRDFFEFQKSIHYDYKLATYDILHSLAHVLVLKKRGLLTKQEAQRLLSALEDLLKEIKAGQFKPDKESEDIHTDIHNKVRKKVGGLASKLHTLRSRNDMVIFDEKWYCYREALKIEELLLNLRKSLRFFAQKYKDQYFVGYTHTQRAQVVYFRDYLLTFDDMFKRDIDRVKRFYNNLFICIGAGALAGSSLGRENYVKALKKLLKGKDKDKLKPLKNPLDNVSSRDFIVEFLSILSILQMHLSRLAEDFILYSTKEFDFFNLPEEFCTGSSLLPHKKNPDFLELVRGYTGKIYGNLISTLTTMKGLPLTYNRDMQLDKESLFSSIDIVKDELKIMAKFIKNIKLNKEVIERVLGDERLYATELAEFLVYRGVPFSKAHDVIGRLVRYSQDERKRIREMPDSLLHTFHKALTQNVIKKIMNPKHAVLSKKIYSWKPSKP